MDAADFDSFYASASGRLVGQIYMMVGNLGEAEDAVQEAFCRAWQRRAQLSAYADPEAWVRTVAYRIAVSSWRKAVNRLRAHVVSAPREAAAAAGAEHVEVVTALRTVTPEQRQAIVLHYFAGLSIAEISLQTGVAAGTVKSRLARGRQTLAEYFTDESDSPMPTDNVGMLPPATHIRAKAQRKTAVRKALTAGAAALLTAGAITIVILMPGRGNVPADSTSPSPSATAPSRTPGASLPAHPAPASYPPGLRPCTLADIEVSVSDAGKGERAGGHSSAALLFRHVGGSACRLYGYPQIFALGAGGERPVTQNLRGYMGGVSVGTFEVVDLANGAVASALVEGSSSNPDDGSSCGQGPVSLRVSLPFDAGSSGQVDWGGISGCASFEGHPFVPGDTGRKAT